MNYYDECLDQNPFFRFVQENHSDLIKNATEENWIICVPRMGTFEPNTICNDDIYENVLVPNLELPITHFYTISKREVCVRDKLIIVNGDYSVDILFDETFYINKHQKYKLWCVERPLHHKYVIVTDGDHFIVRNVHDCFKVLWTKDHKFLNNIHQLIEVYLTEEIQFKSLETLKEKTSDLYKQSVELISKEAFFGDKICLAIETYIQHCVHLKLLRAVCNFTSRNDADLNKILRNFSDIQLKDLDIHPIFSQCISSTKGQLSNFNKVVTVLGKIECLRRIVNVISSLKNVCVTTDDLLKIFVLLVIKSNVNNWIANLTFITHFRFSSPNLKDENSFLITTLEAAIEYIRKGDIKVKYRCDNDNLSEFFTCIKNGDLAAVKKICNATTKYNKEGMALCHPLCVCDKCGLSNAFNINSCNDKGLTALHISCLYGHPHLVEFFLSNGANVNVVDDLGSSPLHYASSKGHQNALLLLLHADADSNFTDCNGNTPLHLAANNGHENCVKAILYFKEQKGFYINVNAVNNVGDSVLHLSSKWGYVGIINILIQYGANPNIRNKWDSTVFDVAHNDHIKTLLMSSAAANIKVELKEKQVNKISQSVSANMEQLKKIDLLLKTIENNDLPLMCYYLGIPTTQTIKNLDTNLICHPLCTCDACQKQFEDVSTSLPSDKTVVLHVNVSNIEGYTPLHVAAQYGRSSILRLLLDKGALVNMKTSKEQLTPLHLSCKHQRIKIVRELLKCGGCNIDVQDAKGNTPLHYACLSNDSGTVELLLSHECDWSIKNANGKTALQEAHCKTFWNVIKLFKLTCNNNNNDIHNDLFSS